MIRNWAVAALAVGTLAACAPTLPQPNYFPPFAAHNDAMPPQDHLLLWLEANPPSGGSTMEVEPVTGTVTRWRDVRPGTQQISPVPSFAGTAGAVIVAVPGQPTRAVRTLNCHEADPRLLLQRCAYVVQDANLDATAYTILGVVARSSPRGDNYFIMTTGSGCGFGGVLCENDTALHVGWSGERTLRLGQYGDDVVVDPTSAFVPNTISLIEAWSSNNGKAVALLEPTFNLGTLAVSNTLLHGSHQLLVGGTPFGNGESQPDWHFVGDIVAILVYNTELSLEDRHSAETYLRDRYGPH